MSKKLSEMTFEEQRAEYRAARERNYRRGLAHCGYAQWLKSQISIEEKEASK